jgi:hypothetical protein
MLKHGLNNHCVQAQLSASSRVRGLGVVASYPALALSAGFFVVTCFVLFKDVWDGASITTDHVMSFAVLVGTFASGHLLSEQLRQWRLLPSLGLLILFAAGTFYCVTASGGRNAASSGAKAEIVHKSNDDRARIEGDLKVAKDRLKEAQDKEADECASGPGTRCKGRKATREERETYVHVLEAQLRLADPAKSEYPELRHAAKVFASVVSVSEQTIFDKLVLWFPFIKALFCEIATLVFGSIAIRHQPRKLSKETLVRETFPRKPLMETVARRKPSLGFLGNPGKPLTKTEALADLLSLADGNGSLPTQTELQKRFGVGSKGTVSKWLSEWEAQGHIKRNQIGRCKAVTLN